MDSCGPGTNRKIPDTGGDRLWGAGHCVPGPGYPHRAGGGSQGDASSPGEGHAAYLERFHREARLAASIRHPNVIRIFEVGQEGDSHFICMEHLPLSVHDFIEARGQLTIGRAVDICYQTALALHSAHQREIVHRDIKPQNMLLGSDGTVKVTDFGIARSSELSTMTGTGALMGTPQYMSPEQAHGDRVSARSDVYSLGCVLYQLLSGELPFKGTTPFEVMRQQVEECPRPVGALRHNVSPVLAKVVEQAMAKDPERRFHKASEMAKALRAADPGGVEQTRQETHQDIPPPQPAAAPAQSRPATPAQPKSGTRAVMTGARRLIYFGATFALTVAAIGAGGFLLASRSGSNGPAVTPTLAGVSAVPALTSGRESNQVPSAIVAAATTPHPTATVIPAIRVSQGVVATSVAASAAPVHPGSFTLTGWVTTAHSKYTATLLSDGRVLVAGGLGCCGVLASGKVYDPTTGASSITGSMATTRYRHTATLLSDGRVLVAGGYDDSGFLASVELYDPNTGESSSTGTMATPRADHTATLLTDGRILVAGGTSDSGFLASAELYDPNTGKFSSTDSMVTPRYLHTATLLSDGRVLVAGGSNDGYLASTEVYDPVTGEFSPAGSMSTARYRHTATLLPNGRVLVAGGWRRGSGGALASAELYDPVTGEFSSTGSMVTARYDHTATLLPDGGYGDGRHASAELYNPSTGEFSNDHTATPPAGY